MQTVQNFLSGTPPELPARMKDELTSTSVLANKKHKSKVYVVGVNHMDPKSREDIKRVIRFVQPKAVLLELCDQRQHMAEVSTGTGILPELSWETIKDNWRLFAQPDFWMFQLQGMKFESLLGTVNGGEQALAASEARDQGSSVLFIDLPYSQTLQKCLISAWHDVGPVRILKEAVFGDLIQTVSPKIRDLNSTLAEFQKLSDEEITDANVAKMRDIVAEYLNKDVVKEIVASSDLFSVLQAPLLHDRDTILAYNMQQASRAFKKCVSIVGSAHVDGITSKFGTVTKQDYTNASEVDTGKLLSMGFQMLLLSQITPAVVLFGSWKAKKVGGKPYRYFKHARRLWFATGFAWCGYGMYKMNTSYNSTRSFQLRMADYRNKSSPS
eukprot:TRINITY_DN6057_c0_g1_i1.p1 TRINITY_DN6057_c0_g1~~TRINITY_DN6057_c0_g1_i1.p1  ORF type:complete len:406 (+),score=68.46 TRINITY_DN6057_c0_g1_i1:71-1219(+)